MEMGLEGKQKAGGDHVTHSETDMTVAHPSTPISNDLVIRDTGEVVDWQDVNSLARALDWLRETEQEFRSAKASVQRSIAYLAEQRGTKTLLLDDGRKASVSGGTKTVWDEEALDAGLRNLGMPEDRIREIVQVEFKVKAIEADRAAKASPDRYGVLIKSCKTEEPSTITVSLRK